MKKVLVLVLAMSLMLACIPAFAEAEEGKVFNIYAWNEEFKGFFERYYEVPEGVTVNWIITPSDNGAYQQKLDEALLNQEMPRTTTRLTCSWPRPTTFSSTPVPPSPRTFRRWA